MALILINGINLEKKTVMKKLLLIVLTIQIVIAMANQNPKPLSADSRMRVVAYDPNNVVTVIGNQLVETSLEFSKDETIVGVYGGDSAAWQVNVNKAQPNILFVKPAVDISDANLTVLTDKHTYHFHLITDAKESASAKDITYNVHFTYPQEERSALMAQLQTKRQLKDSLVSDESFDPSKVNWEYSFSGRCAKDFVPIKAFDNGKFTFFQFSSNTEIPAIFIVDQKGKESLANWRAQGPYIVIQRIARQFSLRNGRVVSCVFNDNYPS